MPSLIPKSSYEVRPRLAVEIRPEGVYAARANDATGAIAQVARAEFAPGTLVPSLRLGNIGDRGEVVNALRHVLTTLQTGKLRDVTVIVPDLAVRVLLLDFDVLPSSVEEALQVVRFRLAKLLPFSPDAAQVSYQVMGQRARQLQVLAVAIPYEVLFEYESVVREAGFEPGAVLPSTLAVASAIDDTAQVASLLVNASESSLTTAILRRGELLLHRTLELHPLPMTTGPDNAVAVLPPSVHFAENEAEYGADDPEGFQIADGPIVEQFIPVAELAEAENERTTLEVQQAINVAAAYYEDSLAAAPNTLLISGTFSPTGLSTLLGESGMVVREALQGADLLPGATTPIALGLLAGLRGALRS